MQTANNERSACAIVAKGRRSAASVGEDGGSRLALSGGHYFADPVEADQPDDRKLQMTERSLLRVAIIAADVGARFASEGIDHDPVAWLLAPRRMFGGAKGIDACRSRLGFCRATVLHGLRLGLDADPMTLDELLDEDLLEDALRLGDDVIGPRDGGDDRSAAPDLVEDRAKCAA